MQQITKSEALKLVHAFHDAGQTWHYHLLTPACQFNDSSKYAIYIENIDTKQSFVLHTNTAEMNLSNKFSSLLHGAEVMDKANTKAGYKPSPEVINILSLINELSKQGVKWHHHVFFPGCTFNSQPDGFELVVEDPRTGKRLVSISDTEPTEDLKQIESAFYSQKM
jgi:hypothetical protein